MSPDGRRIAFERLTSPIARPRLRRAVYVMNTDGTGVRRLTPWRLNAGDGPDWSPDGSRILFRSRVAVNDERSQLYRAPQRHPAHPDYQLPVRPSPTVLGVLLAGRHADRLRQSR